MNFLREPERELTLADLARLKDENTKKVNVVRLMIDEFWELYDVCC